MATTLNVGIVALQGAFDLHKSILESTSNQSQGEVVINAVEVKRPGHCENLDAIILPGGESTVIEKLMDSSGLGDVLAKLIENKIPVLGTCAGLILLANYFKVLDVKVSRNAYGTQIDSFNASVDIPDLGSSCEGFFIRAPKIDEVYGRARVLALFDGEVVGVSQENIFAVSFHPEVAGDSTIHEIFVDKILQGIAL